MSLLVFFDLLLMSGKSTFSFIFMSFFHCSCIPLHFLNFILMIWLKFASLLNNFTSCNNFFFVKIFKFGLMNIINYLHLNSSWHLDNIDLIDMRLLTSRNCFVVVVFCWLFIHNLGIDFLVMLLSFVLDLGVMSVLIFCNLHFKLLDLGIQAGDVTVILLVL